MRILHVASEATPFAGTGGLGEVLGTLPRALAELGHDVTVLLPLYRSARTRAPSFEAKPIELEVPIGDRVHVAPLWRTKLPDSQVTVLLLEHDPYYNREGLYGTADGDFRDNAERFIFLARATMESMVRLEPFDVVHAHDWQTALVPVYLRTLYADRPACARTRSVITIHNLAFQGTFWHWDMKLTGLDWSLFNWRELEFYGRLNFLKGGMVFAHAITTVSPRYAEEIRTPEFGCGMQDVLRGRAADLVGILNGIDPVQWDPAKDKWIPANYDSANLKGKAACKRALQKKCGLPEEPGTPLLGMVSRVTEQKGFDLVVQVLPDLLRQNVQFVLLGAGEERYQKPLEELARRHRTRMSVQWAFDPRLAHEIEAGADLFLMPSRFEPCGLNQLYSLRYGTIPVVHAVGGLADTVVDATPDAIARGTATGFVFGPYTATAFREALDRALAAWRSPKGRRRLMATAMAQDFTWKRSAEQYSALYRKLTGRG